MSDIVITGATAGIGRAAAILLANKGHRVFAAGRNQEALDELENGYERISGLRMDVTDPQSVNAAAKQVMDALDGRAPDVLVNNAGYALAGPLEVLADEDWERQYQTNVLGLVRVTRAFLPAMRERRRGRIDRGFEIRGECKVIPRPPSEYLKRFTYDTIAYSEPIMADLVRLVGADRIMMGSDYCLDIAYNDPVSIVTGMKSLNEQQRQQILWGNAAKLLRLE